MSEYKTFNKSHEKRKSKAVPIGKGLKALKSYEKELLEKKEISNITHKNSSSVWLEAPCKEPENGMTNVYRPMGDKEAEFLVTNHILPNTQPYQSIVAGLIGRDYADKYLTGKKYTDTCPTTIVEFCVPIAVIKQLEEIQTKVEDGAISMGLGDKAGGGLSLFNDALVKNGSYRIVKIKRSFK